MSKEQFTDLQVAEQCGETCLTFGKYEKWPIKKVAEVDLPYLQWAVKNIERDDRIYISKYLDTLK